MDNWKNILDESILKTNVCFAALFVMNYECLKEYIVDQQTNGKPVKSRFPVFCLHVVYPSDLDQRKIFFSILVFYVSAPVYGICDLAPD